MFFDNPEDVPKIAEKNGFAIFILEDELINSINPGKKRIKTATVKTLEFPNITYFLEPDEKNSIRVDHIRNLEAEMLNKQISSRLFVIKHAETMNEAAENAALKLLEEPKENCHLVFLATSLTTFLPTILSRAAVYVQKVDRPLDSPVAVDEETLKNARALLSASQSETFRLITGWTNKKGKPKTRPEVLKILAATIEIAYKSYFKTENQNFLKKVPSLIAAYQNIKGNGHIKLQLTAHLC